MVSLLLISRRPVLEKGNLFLVLVPVLNLLQSHFITPERTVLSALTGIWSFSILGNHF